MGTVEQAGHRILLVEDSPDVGELLQMALVDQGFIVLHVVSAEEALWGLSRLSPRELPHVILFDLRLPGMGGDDLSRTLQARPEWQNIPRVLMTGKTLAPHEEAALGVNEVFRKPVDITALFAGLHRLADRRSFSAFS
jgi:CheY-like chemotaxis protein